MTRNQPAYVVAPLRQWVLRLGLWPRMALPLSLGFLALFATFAILGERALRDSTDRLLKERLVIAQMAARQLDERLQQAATQLQQTQRFGDFDPAHPDQSAEAQVLAVFSSREGTFSAIAFLDPGGRVVLSHPPDHALPGTDLSGLPYVATTIQRPAVSISVPFHDRQSNRPVVAITIPMDDHGRFLGFLSGLIDLSGPAIMAPLEQAATLSRTGHAVLVDAQGQVLASTFQAPLFSPGEHATFYRQAIARGQPIVATVPTELSVPGEPGDQPHVTAFAPLGMARWGVAVGGDVDETFAGVRQLRLGLALLSVVSLISAWAVTLIGTRRLVRPVQRLTDAAQRIAGGDFHTPLQAPEGGEIGALAAALERMRTLLLANIEGSANKRWVKFRLGTRPGCDSIVALF